MTHAAPVFCKGPRESRVRKGRSMAGLFFDLHRDFVFHR